MVCWSCLVGSVVVLCLIYKLVDALLRRPRVNRLNDRYIVVTGCDTGFGHGIARRLDSLGCHVFAGCLTQKGETELRQVCSDRLTTLSMDVSDPDSVRRAFDAVKKQLPADQGTKLLLRVTETHSVGQSSYFVGKTCFKIMYEKLSKCPIFLRHLPEKLTEFPKFT